MTRFNAPASFTPCRRHPGLIGLRTDRDVIQWAMALLFRRHEALQLLVEALDDNDLRERDDRTRSIPETDGHGTVPRDLAPCSPSVSQIEEPPWPRLYTRYRPSGVIVGSSMNKLALSGKCVTA